MEKLYIKFEEGNQESLHRACREAEKLGYEKSPSCNALKFEGYGLLILYSSGFYGIADQDEEALIQDGYKEHKMGLQFEEGERVLVRDGDDEEWKERIYITTDKHWFHIVVVSGDEKDYEKGRYYYPFTYKQIKKLDNTVTLTADNGEKLTVDRKTAENLGFNFE